MVPAFFLPGHRRRFSLDEAREMLPLVRRITRASYEQVEALRIQAGSAVNPEHKSELHQRMERAAREWQAKIQKLGCEAKGLWLVDFDSGTGFYCWHFPEQDIRFQHGYEEGLAGRCPIPAPPSGPVPPHLM